MSRRASRMRTVSLRAAELPGALEQQTVLVVEDDPSARELLAALLVHHGAIVVSAASVAEAMARLEHADPSLLISDIGLPEEDGLALIARIRARESRTARHLAAVAISGEGGDVGARACRAGFDQFLSKPIDVDALLVLLQALATPLE